MAKKNDSKAGLFIGTSGWAYPIWKPEFYPKEVKSKDFLKYYSTQLNATEVNYTFRRTVTEKAQTQWIADTVDDFRFKHRMPSRAAAVRDLFRLGLASSGITVASVDRKSADFGALASAAKGKTVANGKTEL